MLMVQSAMDSDQDSVPSGSMQLQNMETVYSKKLEVFQEAQKRQAQLVQKLQTKVAKTYLSILTLYSVKTKVQYVWLSHIVLLYLF